MEDRVHVDHEVGPDVVEGRRLAAEVLLALDEVEAVLCVPVGGGKGGESAG